MNIVSNVEKDTNWQTKLYQIIGDGKLSQNFYLNMRRACVRTAHTHTHVNDELFFFILFFEGLNSVGK